MSLVGLSSLPPSLLTPPCPSTRADTLTRPCLPQPDETLAEIVRYCEAGYLNDPPKRHTPEGAHVPDRGYHGLSRPVTVTHLNQRLRHVAHSTYTTLVLVKTKDFTFNFHPVLGLFARRPELVQATVRTVFCLTTPLPFLDDSSPAPFTAYNLPHFPRLDHTFAVATNYGRKPVKLLGFNSSLALPANPDRDQNALHRRSHRVEKQRILKHLTPQHTLHLDTSLFPFREKFVDIWAAHAESLNRQFAIRLSVGGHSLDDLYPNLHNHSPYDFYVTDDERIEPADTPMADYILASPLKRWLTTRASVTKIEIVGDGTHPFTSYDLHRSMSDMLAAFQEGAAAAGGTGTLDARLCWVGEEPGVHPFETVLERWEGLGEYLSSRTECGCGPCLTGSLCLPQIASMLCSTLRGTWEIGTTSSTLSPTGGVGVSTSTRRTRTQCTWTSWFISSRTRFGCGRRTGSGSPVLAGWYLYNIIIDHIRAVPTSKQFEKRGDRVQMIKRRDRSGRQRERAIQVQNLEVGLKTTRQVQNRRSTPRNRPAEPFQRGSWC